MNIVIRHLMYILTERARVIEITLTQLDIYFVIRNKKNALVDR